MRPGHHVYESFSHLEGAKRGRDLSMVDCFDQSEST